MFEIVAASAKPHVVRGLAASYVFQDSCAFIRFFSSRESLARWQHVLSSKRTSYKCAEQVYQLLRQLYQHPHTPMRWYSNQNALQILLSELYRYYQEYQDQPVPHDLKIVFQIMRDHRLLLLD